MDHTCRPRFRYSEKIDWVGHLRVSLAEGSHRAEAGSPGNPRVEKRVNAYARAGSRWYVTALQHIAAEHRDSGDPNNLANAIHSISIHILSSDVR